MKLAEALILRADCHKRIEQLKVRLNRSVKVQEGEEPPEKPADLLKELDQTLAEFNRLVKQINKTNVTVSFDASMTLTDALAERDRIALRRNILSDMISAAAIKQDRFSKSEVKFVATISIAKIQKQVDLLSKEYREIDTRIQELNWKTELID